MGFKYARVNGRRVVCEKPSVVLKKIAFLRRYNELQGKYKFVFLDETWIFQRGSQKQKTWQDIDIRSSPLKTTNQGKRYIVLHAGGEDGFVDGASLVFASDSSQGDYHGQMNGQNFMNWWYKLLDKLTEPTVIVNPQPTSSWRKDEIADWLRRHNVRFTESMLKVELYALAKLHRQPIRYLADEEAAKRGHIVLRLPPYHCQYNPIELIWALLKRHYDKHILEYGEFTEEKCLEKWHAAIESVTPEIWGKVVNKIDKLVRQDWELFSGIDKVDCTDYSKMKFPVNGDSSDSDSEYGDYNVDEDEEDVDDPNPKSPSIVKPVTPFD
ncbi:hypothetical protein FOCC_FOCC004433, partial [Frankliniella occidentalis]